MCTLGFTLFSHSNPALWSRAVSSCAESGSAWETSRCDAVEEFSASDAVGAIGDADCGDAMLGEGRGMPPVGSCLLSVKCLEYWGRGGDRTC